MKQADLRFIIIIFFAVQMASFTSVIAQSDTIRVDSIRLQHNWRTRNHVINRELGFREGGQVSVGRLDTAVMRLWNVGNFSKVSYKLKELDSGGYLVRIKAKDAFTIVPLVSYNGSKQDWTATLGVSDNNFLGRNIGLDLGGVAGTNAKRFWMGFNIPRQLLYGNMALGINASIGHSQNRQIRGGKVISGVSYANQQVGLFVANPWHDDFKYRFSPDLSLGYFHHDVDSVFDHNSSEQPRLYDKHFVRVGFSESVGFIKRKRHQRDGYSIGASVGGGVDIGGSEHYLSLGANANYHRLINRFVQFNLGFNTGHTTSQLPSLIHYRGSGDVRGIITGEISGRSYYAASAGVAFTYVNRDWIAVEHSFYINAGQGADRYPELMTSLPQASVGSGLYFYIPSIPWMGFRLYFTHKRGSDNWFQFVL